MGYTPEHWDRRPNVVVPDTAPRLVEPTRAARVLYIVLSSQKEFVVNVVIGSSDHNQLHFNINKKSDKTKVKQCRRHFRKGNYEEIRKRLALIFATTLCQPTLRPTSLTFLQFTPLPVSFAHVLTTLSSVVHLSVPYPMVKYLSHTQPLLLGTLFLSRSARLIMSLPSDPELKLTFSVLPTNCFNVSVVICVPQSFISCVVG